MNDNVLPESIPQPFQPSGLNNGFYFEGLKFHEYIDRMRLIIAKTRTKLHNGQTDLVIDANSPFEWIPENQDAYNPQTGRIKKGVLLIHGLFDSPNTLLSVAEHFKARNFLVRAILLPGHGTVPGDLLHIDYREWVKATEYGVASFINQVDDLYLCGFSTGAALALYQAYHDQGIKGIILFAPAIKLRRHLSIITYLNHLMTKTVGGIKWFIKVDNHDYAKYTSFTFNSGHQVNLLTKELAVLSRQHTLKTPTYIAMSEDDEVISYDAVVSYFNNLSNPANYMRIYSNKITDKQVPEDQRIEYINSFIPEKKILHFSHVCIAVAPEHPHYGENGDYHENMLKQTTEASNEKVETDSSEIYLGALIKENLQKLALQRLTYNPDYSKMMQSVDNFIQSLE